MNTITYLNNHTGDFATIRTELYALGICWCDSLNGKFANHNKFRVIFYLDRRCANFKNPMVRECNGLVLEYFKDKGWTVLVVPPQAFNLNQISIKYLFELYNSGVYNVYEALDSTIVNLYYYEDKWCLSTTKGYDSSNFNLCGNKTYMDVFNFILNHKYKDFSYDNLEKHISYTFSLRYAPYHIFIETKSNYDSNTSIELIQAINCYTLRPSYDGVTGINTQTIVKVKDRNLNTLLNNVKNAFSRFDKNTKMCNTKIKPFYGYILRTSNASVPDEYKNIYLESSLMKLIRNGIYKNNEALRNLDYNKVAYSLYMNRSYFDKYKIVFSQFETKFNQIQSLVDQLTSSIGLSLKHELETENSDINNFIQMIILDMKSNNIISNQNNDISESVIYDYIYNKKYQKELYDLLFKLNAYA
jgi:hypothetical protein